MQIEEEDKEFLIVKGISRILHEQNPFESEPPLIEWCGVQVDRFDARTLLNSPLDLNSSSSFGQTSQQSKTLTYSNLKEKQQEQDEERLCDIERYQDLDSFSTSSSRTFSLTEDLSTTSAGKFDFHAVPFNYDSFKNEENSPQKEEKQNIGSTSQKSQSDFDTTRQKFQSDCSTLMKTLEILIENINSSSHSTQILLSLFSSDIKEQIVSLNQKLNHVLEQFTQRNVGDNVTNENETQSELSVTTFHPPFPTPPDLQLPPDELTHQIICRTAQFLQHSNDPQTQLQNLLSSLKDNPNFAFLQSTHPLHPYFSFLMLNDQERAQIIIKKQYELDQKRKVQVCGTKFNIKQDTPTSSLLTVSQKNLQEFGSPSDHQKAKDLSETLKNKEKNEILSISSNSTSVTTTTTNVTISPTLTKSPTSTTTATTTTTTTPTTSITLSLESTTVSPPLVETNQTSPTSNVSSERTTQQISRLLRAKEFLKQISEKEKSHSSSKKRQRSSSTTSSSSSSSTSSHSNSHSHHSSDLNKRNEHSHQRKRHHHSSHSHHSHHKHSHRHHHNKDKSRNKK